MASDLMDVCHEEVSRRGEAQPCDRPAIAMAADPEGAYPVCQGHLRGRGVPLAEYRAQVKAEALREAADQWPMAWPIQGHEWLRARADQISRGGGDRG